MSAGPLHSVTRRLGITPRIRALAAQVPRGTRCFVDVGTNHGILPVAVLRDARALRCVAIDRSSAALAETRRRLVRSGLQDRIALCCGDGLAAVALEAVDVVALAGLAERPIVEILTRALPRLADGPRRLVLSPLGSGAAVRAFLAEHGFELVHDGEITARGRSYPLLVATR